MNVTKIAEFYGIQQQRDGTMLNNGSARDAVNMETGDGNLAVSEAFHVLVSPPPRTGEGTEEWRALFAFERATTQDILIACSNKRIMYCLTEGYSDETFTWTELLTFDATTGCPSAEESAFDAQLARIWNDDCILIATGGTRIIKVFIDQIFTPQLGKPLWTLFGSGVYYGNPFEIAAVNTGDDDDIANAVITIGGSRGLNDDERMRAIVYGVYIMAQEGDEYTVKYLLYPDIIEGISDDGRDITLDLTGCNVSTENVIGLRGGTSNKKVSSLELFKNRLWSAGDPENTSRLYWSCAAGEGRTVEDWISDDYYEDASGGHVDVGSADGDRIVALKAMSDCILIFKVNSVWRLYGDRPSSYTLERISDEVGAYDDKEVVTKRGIPYWLTRNGMYYSDGSGCAHVDQEVDYLKDLFWEVNGMIRRSAVSVPAIRKMLFNVYSDDIGSFILTRDDVTGSYLTFNGAQFTDLATASDEALFLTSDGAVLHRAEDSEQLLSYAGEPLEARWESQIMELNTLATKAQAKALYFRASGGRIHIRIQTDIGSVEQEVVPSDMQTNVVRIPVNMAESRYMRIFISNVQGSRFEIQGGICILYDRIFEG